jgi:NAD(P)-dependent dehydrogenase (short-subunit alcohol dehydrogenase family)
MVSDAALRPAPLGSDHACSKAALVRLTDSLALAAWEHGVAVFGVGPGLSHTEEGVAAEPLARLVADLAAGCADRLSGRLLHLQDDLDELLQRVEEVEREELYQLRLRRLEPLPPEGPPPAAEGEAAEGEATAREPAGEAAAAGSAPASS